MYTSGWKADIYHPRHPMGRLFHEHRLEVMVDALNAVDFALEEARVLDFGCGDGAWLRLLIDLGADPGKLTGMDLSASRIAGARRANPAVDWQVVDGGAIPAADAQFDLVLQTTVFSSILDAGLTGALAREMDRVTRPGGAIFWADLLHGDPGRLRAFTRDELQRLFPAYTVAYERRAYPGYFRRFYAHPWLCRLLAHWTSAQAEYLVVILQKPPRA
jgi:SAM-dependent methyltransferase